MSSRPDPKTTLLILLAVVPVLAFFAVSGALPQDPDYHRFADTRSFLGIPHFWNVCSNLALLLVGGRGLWLERRQRLVHDLPAGAPVYAWFFAGVALTGLGSAWYHWAPDNGTLFWDRLSMTVGFMALTVAVLAEHVAARLAHRLLWPLLTAGAASVLYWHVTEQLGRGDLRPYAVVQFLPLLVLPAVCLLFRSRFSRSGELWLVLGGYVLAKLAEQCDAQLFVLTGGWLGGHALKHLLSALAVWWLVRMLRLRSRVDFGGEKDQGAGGVANSPASSSTVRAK